jgi:hypothetical protein
VALPAVIAILLAFGKRWVCDDAFISFRYAENLVNGLGLVFNAGERVEGYTNFLWTVWIAVGMRMGADPEVWSMAWGLAFYGATIGLLGLYHLRVRRAMGRSGLLLPLAALMGAVHGDWNIWATGGLETACFTFQCVMGFMVLVAAGSSTRKLAAAGLVLATASMTRPDGVIFVALAGVWVFWTQRPRRRAVLAFGSAFTAIWVPYTLWRVWYYGDLFPNTFYAKSAYLAWYSQGWVYVRLYFAKYWALLAGPVLAGACLAASRRNRLLRKERPAIDLPAEAALAGAFALFYMLYIMRVGGGFMYARLLIPATPFLLVLLELGLGGLSERRAARWRFATAGLLIAAVAWSPHPLGDRRLVSGIANEWLYYPPERTAEVRAEGETLCRYFDGLPVRVACFGTEARLVYYSKPAVAIESDAGLTDRAIAHRPLAERGRVGHEKKPTAEYLIRRRKVHFVFHPRLDESLGLDDLIPRSGIFFDDVAARILHWDPALMKALAGRGARFEEFTEFLDRFLAGSDELTPEQLRDAFAKCKLFYFDHVDDPQREQAFRIKLGMYRKHSEHAD